MNGHTIAAMLPTVLLVLLAAAAGLGTLLAILAARAHRLMRRHVHAGRGDLAQTRVAVEDTRARSRSAAFAAIIIQRGAETDAERVERLRAEAEVRARGRFPGAEWATGGSVI